MLTPIRLLALLVVAVVLASCGADGEATPLRQGRTIYGDTCSVCHGDRGQGLVGPSLDAVVETWPSCDAHVEWVELGSAGWIDRHGDTYGATDKPVEGGMPSHANRLEPGEMRLVALFERVTYGGQVEAEALADCRIE